MKLYNDIYDIPIKNFIRIQESMLINKPDYSFLIKRGRCRNRLKLKEAYFNLLYQFPKIDNDLNKAWGAYKLAMQYYINALNTNKFANKHGFKEVENHKYTANKAFKEYLDILQVSYTDFEFEICFLYDDFKEIYEAVKPVEQLEKPPIPENFNFKLEFFFIDEFIKYISQFEENFGVYVFAGYDILINSEFRKFSDETYGIDKINKRLEDFYRETKQYDKWFLIRYNMFNIDTIKFRSQETHTIMNDVISVSNALNQDIDIDNRSVGQFFNNYIPMAEEINKNAGKVI